MKPFLQKVLLVFGSVLVSVGACEAFLRYAHSKNDYSTGLKHFPQIIYQGYSSQEMNSSLPLYSREMGSDCLRSIKTGTFNYHPYFGFNGIHLDPDCGSQFLSGSSKSVIFLGGSLMANTGAPNYLTTIDQYVHRAIPGLKSLNLAESGTRSTNELIRFLLEVINLRPQVVVFLSGGNEFHSILRGGPPDDDFYWTAGVRDRIHHPMRFLLDRVIYKSEVLKLIVFKTGLLHSHLYVRTAPSLEQIHLAAQLYVENTNKVTVICQAYQIHCLFFLQPTLLGKTYLTSEEKLLEDYWNSIFPNLEKTFSEGYKYIKENVRVHLVDLSNSIQTKEHVYLDLFHMNKLGNEVIGQAIATELKKLLL